MCVSIEPNPRAVFPHFYDNPVIHNVLAPLPLWTVSDPTSKMPIDARHLLNGCTSMCTHPDIVRGAWAHDERVLVTLNELTDTLPSVANCAMWLDAVSQGCVVLDIEKTCPPDVRDQLLKIGALYAELSLSGKGYHLILPLPRSFHSLPLAAAKSVLKSPHGWWEILQSNHFVTFTRYPTDIPVSETIDHDLWDTTWLSLARDVNADLTLVHEFDVEDRPDYPWYEGVLSVLINRTRWFHGTLAKYDNDHSRYEWAYAQYIYTRRLRLRHSPTPIDVTTPGVDTTNATPTHTVPVNTLIIDEATTSWLIYETLVHYLDHRPKHDETRNGLPLLLSLASRVVATQN